MARKPYSTDVSDDEWAFVAPYLALLAEDAGQRRYELREVFNGLRYVIKGGVTWRLVPNDLPPWEIVYQQTQRWLRAEVFEAMPHDLRLLLRTVAGHKAQPTAANAAAAHGITLEVVKLEEAKRGFVLMPRRWVVERSLAWTTRFRRLVRDYERLPETDKGLHFVAFACLMLNKSVTTMLSS